MLFKKNNEDNVVVDKTAEEFEEINRKLVDISFEIESLDKIINSHLGNYKDNYNLYCKESKEISDKIKKIQAYCSVLNDSLSKFVKEQIYNNELLKTTNELNYLKNDFNHLMIAAEFNAINQLPWYKRMFKSCRINAVSKAAVKVLEDKKPELDKKRMELDEIFNKIEQFKKDS